MKTELIKNTAFGANQLYHLKITIGEMEVESKELKSIEDWKKEGAIIEEPIFVYNLNGEKNKTFDTIEVSKGDIEELKKKIIFASRKYLCSDFVKINTKLSTNEANSGFNVSFDIESTMEGEESEIYNFSLTHFAVLSKNATIEKAKPFFELNKDQLTELEGGTLQYSHHWRLFSFQGVYSMDYDGNYEEYFATLEDMIYRRNALHEVVVAYGEDLSREVDEGIETDQLTEGGAWVQRLFKTEAEAKAYTQGILDMDGWNGFLVLNPDQIDEYKFLIEENNTNETLNPAINEGA